MGDSSEAVPQLHPQKTRRSSRARRQKRAYNSENAITNGHGGHSDTNGTPPRQISSERAKPVSVSAQPTTETPLKPAYAGPTFHASPAASSLPVPRFFSKSVPANADQPGLQARLNIEESYQSEGPASSSASTPKLAIPEPARDREPTPIDFLLNADRNERARAESNGSGSHTPDHDPFFQNVQSEPPRFDQLPENLKELPSNRVTSPVNRTMFPMELDGTQAGDPQSTPRHTPSQPRTMASRSSTDPSKLFQADNEAAAQSLKDLLGVHSNSKSPPAAMPYAHNYSNTSPQLRRNHSSNSSIPLSGSPSAPITPPDGPRRQTSNFHYGNRNLSPLFQAARAPPQRPSSGLRQEVEQEAPIPAELPANNGPIPLPNSAEHDASASPPVKNLDAKAFSRAYLDAQIQAANSHVSANPFSSRSGKTSQKLPNSSSSAAIGREPSPFNSPLPASAFSDQHGVSEPSFRKGSFTSSYPSVNRNSISGSTQSLSASNGSPVHHAASNTQDVKAMEDNLRKILNLHIAGAPNGMTHPC